MSPLPATPSSIGTTPGVRRSRRCRRNPLSHWGIGSAAWRPTSAAWPSPRSPSGSGLQGSPGSGDDLDQQAGVAHREALLLGDSLVIVWADAAGRPQSIGRVGAAGRGVDRPGYPPDHGRCEALGHADNHRVRCPFVYAGPDRAPTGQCDGRIHQRVRRGGGARQPIGCCPGCGAAQPRIGFSMIDPPPGCVAPIAGCPRLRT